MGFFLCIRWCISVLVLQVGGVGNHGAALPSEVYWKNKLPNTPMPAILHDLLHPAGPEKEGNTLTDVRAGSFKIYTPTRTNTISHDDVAPFKYENRRSLNKSTIPHDNAVSFKYTNVPSLGKSTIPRDDAAPFHYSNDPSLGKSTIPNQVNDNAATKSPGASLFFLEKDLHTRAKLNLHFVVSTARGTTFLPQKLAKVIPFSSHKFPEILNQFSINPKSKEAEAMNETIMDCEEPAIENEEKFCATSLESLVEYGTSKFGKNVNVMTTVIVGDKGQRTRMRKQQYVVSSGLRPIVSDNLVVCHSLPYLYAVFYCHATSAHTTRAYVVPLVGADGTKIKATAVCHKDTSKWYPGHVAFQLLKVKPGSVPICHFLTEDTIAWAGKN
ncbi:hypothetical protein MKX01_009274 [Papaver californicum]|nr:hypothetical protein MKX01_009274 [Papaver californicum]